MKFCPVVPEICRGQVHGPRKERKEKNNNKKRRKNNKSPKLCLGDLIIITQQWYIKSRSREGDKAPLFELSYRWVKTCFNRIFPCHFLFCYFHFELCLSIFWFLLKHCFGIRFFSTTTKNKKTAPSPLLEMSGSSSVYGIIVKISYDLYMIVIIYQHKKNNDLYKIML